MLRRLPKMHWVHFQNDDMVAPNKGQPAQDLTEDALDAHNILQNGNVWFGRLETLQHTEKRPLCFLPEEFAPGVFNMEKALHGKPAT